MACAVSETLLARRQARVSPGAVWMTGLLLEPLEDVAAPVADRAADREALGSGAEVAPVARSGDGDADEVSDFGQVRHDADATPR